MPDLIAAVQAEHRRVLELADRILQSVEQDPEGGGVAGKDVRALIALESRHEVTEARFLWPVVRDTLPEYAAVMADAKAQERDARRRLDVLRKAGTGPEAARLVPPTIKALVAHVGLEESLILPSLADRLSPNDAARIGQMYEEASAAAPTRPHPRVPAVPGLLTLTGPVAARTDRMRDLLRRP